MGGCTTSKYAVDEDKAPKKEKKLSNKKNKKDSQGEQVDAAVVPAQEQKPNGQAATEESGAKSESDNKIDSAAKDIEFIDKEDKHATAATTTASNETDATKDNDDTKKEVTTYQTTVVKHTQKEGDELLQHLKDEAFRSLQNLLKQDSTKQTSRSTTASTANSAPQTSTESTQDDVVEQIKAQVVDSVGKAKQDTIHLIIDNGIDLIKQSKVKNMNELQTSLEKLMPDTEAEKNSELIKKVINATTGFLTAKGTEAGALLSNILANASNGLTGVMNETEKTTVKVTRTVTEQIMSGGQLKEVTRVITSTEPAPPCAQNIEDVLKNLQNGLSVDGSPFITTTTLVSQPTVTVTTASPAKVVTSGNTTTLSSTVVNETHETSEQKEESLTETKVINEDSITKSQAEHVVTTAVNAAVERVRDESKSESSTTSKLTNGIQEVITNGHHVDSSVQEIETHSQQFHEENIKVEEESSIKCSTTKIVLNGSSKEEDLKLNSFDLDQVQSEFYKHGKEAAEEVVQQINESTFNESYKSQQQQSSTNATSSSTTTTTTTLVTE